MFLPNHATETFGGDPFRITKLFRALIPILLMLLICATGRAQSTASIDGEVTDQRGAVVSGVQVVAINPDHGIRRVTATDHAGRYQFAALPIGVYQIEVQAKGFQSQIINALRLEVGRTVTLNFELKVGDVTHSVTVPANNQSLELSTMSVGHVVDQRMVQQLPLNGRYFLDLGLLVPGSVTSPPGGLFIGADPWSGILRIHYRRQPGRDG